MIGRMTQAQVTDHIRMLGGVDIVDTGGHSFFFFYNPADGKPADHKFPFATLVTTNAHDKASDLDRDGVYRLNIGVSKQTFGTLFGERTANEGYDFATLDQIMPHPVYGAQYWVCVLNPDEVTFAKVKDLLAEAYSRAVDKRSGRDA